MTWEVKLVKIINLPPLKLCESRVMVSYLPPGVHHQHEVSWNRSPAHCVAASKSACNTLLFRSDSTLQSLCRRGNSSPEGKTNHKWACLTWSLTARVTCCLLVQLWPSQWFQWAGAKVVWHISVPVTDFNTLTLSHLLMLVRRGSSLNRTGLTRVDPHTYITAHLLLRSETSFCSVCSHQTSLRYCCPMRGIFGISPEDKSKLPWCPASSNTKTTTYSIIAFLPYAALAHFTPSLSWFHIPHHLCPIILLLLVFSVGIYLQTFLISDT